MSANTDAVESALDALAGPLRLQLGELDALILQEREELSKLSSTRSKLQKALALIDPEVVPAKKKYSARDKGVAPETLANIENWILVRKGELNANGGFSAPDLFRSHGFDLVSDATLSKALGLLHERGAIRLDHRGNGGAKVYKVT
jgi:hypothetical protein